MGDRLWGKQTVLGQREQEPARASIFLRLLNKKLLEEEAEVEPETLPTAATPVSITAAHYRSQQTFLLGHM